MEQSDLSDLKFRVAKPDDGEKISALVNSAYRGESSQKGWTTEAELLGGQRTDPEAIREIINLENNTILLCEHNGQLLGSVVLEAKENQRCYFGMFAVDPNLQAKGIGKIFIHCAEKYARENLRRAVMEMTVINHRTELIQWYQRRGYQLTGESRSFPYGDERFGIPKRPDILLQVLEKRL